MDQKQAFATTVCGHIDDAVRNSLPRRSELHGLAVERHSPLAGNEAEQAADLLHAALKIFEEIESPNKIMVRQMLEELRRL